MQDSAHSRHSRHIHRGRRGGRPAAGAVGALAALTVLTGCDITVGGEGLTAEAQQPTSAPSERVIGPDGLGPFKVGMTLQEAVATGEFKKEKEDPEACMGYTTDDDIRVGWSGRLGVTSVSAENVRTPEGIGPGTTFAKVVRTYERAEADDPPLDEAIPVIGTIWTSVPDRPKNMYAIKFDMAGVANRDQLFQAPVQVVVLKLKAEQNC